MPGYILVPVTGPDFRDFCKREGFPASAEASSAVPSAEWRLETGDAAGWLAEHGRAADLVVVGRARNGEAVVMDLLEAALIEASAAGIR
jgi:hypothetical protein